MSCEWHDNGTAELHFYGELDPAARERFDAHLAGCNVCRSALAELDVIARALDVRRRDATPPGGDWSGLMARLDQRLQSEGQPHAQPWWRFNGLRGALKAAAMVALVSAGVMAGRQWEHWRHPDEAGTEVTSTDAPAASDFLAALAEQHLERSKLVLLGLATKDPRDARPADWRFERDLAGRMLADTAQYRLSARQQGLSGLADVLGDLEVVLLQASLSDEADPGALARLQNLIGQRDLLVKIEVLGVGEPEEPARRPAGGRPTGKGV